MLPPAIVAVPAPHPRVRELTKTAWLPTLDSQAQAGVTFPQQHLSKWWHRLQPVNSRRDYVACPFAGCMCCAGTTTGSFGITIQATMYVITPNSGSGQMVMASQSTRTSVTSTSK